jgi:hypothetical protein
MSGGSQGRSGRNAHLLFLKSLSLLECEEDISLDEDSPLGMALSGKPCSFDVVVVMNLFLACWSRSSTQRSTQKGGEKEGAL